MLSTLTLAMSIVSAHTPSRYVVSQMVFYHKLSSSPHRLKRVFKEAAKIESATTDQDRKTLRGLERQYTKEGVLRWLPAPSV